MRNRWIKGSLLLVVGLLALVGWSGRARAAGTDTVPSYVAEFSIAPFDGFRYSGSSGTVDVYDLDNNPASVTTLIGKSSGFNVLSPIHYPQFMAAINLNKGILYYQVSSTDKTLPPLWYPANSQTELALDLGSTTTNATAAFTVKFVDQDNTELDKSENISFAYREAQNGSDPLTNLAAALQTASRDFPGYSLAADNPLTVTPATDSQPTTYTYHYTKDTATGGNTNTGNNTNTGTNTSGIAGTSGTATMPTTDSSSSTASQVTTTKAPVQRKAVYAVKKIGLYSQPTFTKQSRTRWFTKQTRPNRPTFTVIGYARSKAGNLRYKVRTADGTTGYITARSAYVTNTYYQHKPAQVKVISAKGLNAYGNVALNGQKIRHYKRGSVLTVKAIKTHGLTTRLVLTNGRYITGNKTFVIAK
ncbi:DUF5776 domain-containing protein [Levilactobacillus mulengensis]|uniref:DUF5776 domain-containing protein n=1 Tax=Levilactobacillus mulengensis TaxID=2486025 RepID=UPI000F76FD73|nr:DUF5776 domain-containing protein [Levilactobacillus mulengensis]